MTKTFVPYKAPSPTKRSDASPRRSVQVEHAGVAVDPLLLAKLATKTSPPIFDEPSSGLLTNGAPGPGQTTKDHFLGLLREHVIAAATEELSGSDWTAEGCPWIEYWLNYYQSRSARDTEAALRRFVPSVAATSADEYLQPLVERVRRAIRQWRGNGSIDGSFDAIPEQRVDMIRARMGDVHGLSDLLQTARQLSRQTGCGC